MSSAEGKQGGEDRIVHTIRIPDVEGEVRVDASRDDILKLISRLISDSQFRNQFNKDPYQVLQGVGIFLDERMAKKLESSTIVHMLKDMAPQPVQLGAGGVAVIVVVLVFVPSPTD